MQKTELKKKQVMFGEMYRCNIVLTQKLCNLFIKQNLQNDKDEFVLDPLCYSLIEMSKHILNEIEEITVDTGISCILTNL